MVSANDIIFFPPGAADYLLKLKEPLFKSSDTEVTYRTINHYQAEKILDPKPSSVQKWRKISSLEIIWLRIVTSLREIGVPLEKIRHLRAKLFDEGQYGHIDKAQYINLSFEKEIALSLFSNFELYLIIFSDFSFTFHDSKSLSQWPLRSYKDETYLNIPLSPIIKNVWKKINNAQPINKKRKRSII